MPSKRSHSLNGGDTESGFTPSLFGIEGPLDMWQKIGRGAIFTSDKVGLLIRKPLSHQNEKGVMTLEELVKNLVLEGLGGCWSFEGIYR